ncbi:MAG TPA: hypothetical protein VMD99_10730 [Terriglobales bacterium]|nr:hypothetical protein [Terriglobales bacterium]
MLSHRICRWSRAAFLLSFLAATLFAQAQGAKQSVPQTPIRDSDADHVELRNEWFYRGRIIRGKPSAELRRRAYQTKLAMRAQRAAALATARANGSPPPSSLPWAPLGPLPLASDATGNGTQNYNQVSGRATAVAIDPADPSGNTVYIGGAQGGIWKSTNAANSTANNVTWNAIADDQATLSIGALVIQPGNSNPANTLILAATGEANNSADSYFGLGILRSADAGGTWTLISTANSGALSFSGLGGTRMAFSTGNSQANTVVSAMATTSEGMVDGAVTTNTTRGLYTSLDAGQTWTYDALTDPGGATDATSATSVVYDATAAEFFAAIRYHGFYSSPDGVNWTRLATQPGGSALSPAACPPQSTSNSYACPIYRGEITVVPGRNEMYAWYIYLSGGEPTDGGIWQSLNGGSSWNAISDTGITNCGDIDGCGVQQGAYNLELQAMPNGAGTDLYAGAINLYKCSINSQNPVCTSPSFLNLTHVYGCDPLAAPSHVHPDQHALAYMIPTSGSDSGDDLMYFANDGGIYRALDGFSGLTTGSCSGTNQFDDLNQNLGSMTQFVSFSQHPSDPNTLLGGTQDNGSPATGQATTNPAWGNILGGDGGYNAIDPNTPLNFYASNPDVPPGGLGIQLCSSGVNCVDSGFNFVVTSDSVGGDDGAFYFPYILDAQSTTSLLVGTCRVWRGPRAGGAYTLLSPNFDTFGSGTCSGSEVNLVQALAAGGPTDGNGSLVVYATTSGSGPLNGALSSPAGGNVWVTANATAGPSTFSNVTSNGPEGSINSNQFPISNVAMDSSDTTGGTAYVTVMGFTAPPGSTTGPGHVWKTTNFGASWTDFTANLPDSPANAVVVDSVNANVYVGTDVGVFVSSTASANWTEVGPSTSQSGFLPNVAVTALGLFNSGGEELLRASTYGRGVWQYPIAATADYQLSVSNTPLTDFAGQNATFNGSAASINGYNSAVTLSCVAGATAPPSTCTISPTTLTPGTNVTFTVTVGGASGAYNFNLQGVGSDAKHVTHLLPLTLDIVSFALSTPTPSTVTVPRGTNSSPVDFMITAAGPFDQSVTVSCSVPIVDAVCTLTPGTTVDPTSSAPVEMTASVSVPAATAPGSYTVTIEASTASAPATLSTAFTLTVTTNPNFTLTESSSFPEVNAGSTGTQGSISITALDGFSGTVALSCANTFGANSCSISPTTVSSFPATAELTINGSSFAPGSYSLTVTGTSGSITQTVNVPFNVGDYSISGTQSLSLNPGGQGVANLTLTSIYLYGGNINATCDASALSGAQCVISPASPIMLAADGTKNVTVTVNVPNNAATGQYNIVINTQDVNGVPSHSFTLALTVSENFIVFSATPIQTVAPGQTTGAYSLSIQPVGSAFNAPVTLSCSGLPPGAQCLFNPSTPITPGTSAVDVVMSISTSSSIINSQPSIRRHAALDAAELFAPGIVILCVLGRRARKRTSRQIAFPAVLALLAVALLSCSGVSNGGGGGGNGNCSSAPGVPAEPESSSPTVTGNSTVSTTLTWPATNTNPACTVTYLLDENGGSSIPVPGPVYGAQLAPGTYSFTVAAEDSVGTSAPSSPPLQVGIYIITITGTSGSLANQATVFLVISSNPAT